MPACGTQRGYQAHHRRREAACDPCKAAHSVYMNRYRQARTRAINRLIARHRGEYALYLANETPKEAAQ